MASPTAAPARWPYRGHRNLAEVDSQTFEQRVRANAKRLIDEGNDELAVNTALRRVLSTQGPMAHISHHDADVDRKGVRDHG